MAHNHFTKLKALGAGEFAHLNGSLETHLINTWQLLKDWQAPDNLCIAGLYHAAYGTDGFASNMVSLQRRKDIARLIGDDAEALVYLYCSCDRKVTFEQLKIGNPIVFSDRFTQKAFRLSQSQAQQFCELTAANELELCIASEAFKQQHGAGLLPLFRKMANYLSKAANNHIQNVLVGH